MVPESTMSTWKTNLGSILITRKHDRRTSSNPVCAYPEMEKVLFYRFCERREEGKIVRRGWFRIASRWLFTEIYPALDKEQFRFSNGWFLGFLSRWGLSIRVTTNKAQQIPDEYREVITNWLKFKRRNSQLRAYDPKR